MGEGVDVGIAADEPGCRDLAANLQGAFDPVTRLELDGGFADAVFKTPAGPDGVFATLKPDAGLTVAGVDDAGSDCQAVV